MNLLDDNLIITNNEFKYKVLLNEKDNKNLKNIKFLSFNNFKKLYYFDYDIKTIKYLVDNLNINIELAHEYLNFMYFLEDKKYKSNKLNNLLKIKKELVSNNLIYFNKQFKNSLENKNVILANEYLVDDFFINDLKKINNFNVFNNKHNIKDLNVYTFLNAEDEISFVAESIIKLLDNDVDISNIYLYNLNEELEILTSRIFKMYNIPLFIRSTSNLLSLNVSKKIIEMIKEKKDINELNTFLQNNIHNPSISLIINILNKYPEDYYNYLDFIMYDFKNTKINNKTNIKSVSVLNSPKELEDFEHVFVMSFNNEYPSYKKDEDYVLDIEKMELNSDTTTIKNKKIKENELNFLLSSNNITITYSKESLFEKYEISSLYLENIFKLKEVSKDSYFNNIFYKYKISKAIDTLIMYNTEDELLNELFHKVNTNYLEYSNKYRKISPKLLRDHLNNKLNLSYSSVNTYYENSFIYYIKYILKIDPFEDSLAIKLGNFSHGVLEKAFDQDFNFDNTFKEEFEKLELNNKEKFYINNLYDELKDIIRVINIQNQNTYLSKSLFEQEINIEYDLGFKLYFKGFIDKINYLEKDNKTYVTLTDYKTGKANINLEHLKFGYNMQLLVYSYLINKSNLFKNPEVLGVYIQTILESKKKFDPKRSKEEVLFDNLKLQGYSINNLNLIKYIDTNYDTNTFLGGVRVTNSGSFYSNARVLTKDQILDYNKLVEEKILNAAHLIMDADFTINPKIYKDKRLGYNYDRYKDICFYTPSDNVYLKEDQND